MRSIPGISAIIDQFDVFLVDQFGVLHNGRAPYPDAVAALQLLRDSGKRVALVSNSAKRAFANLPRMRRLGFEDGLYDAFITSGEAAYCMMTGGLLGEASGKKTIVFALDEDRSFMEDTGLIETGDPAQADLLIIAGSEAPRLTLDDYRARLEPLAKRNLPALCLNPDKVMLLGDTLAFAPGAIADLYLSMGGQVRWIGKPFPDIYRIALDVIGAKPGERILCIGDSLEHDIAGARSIEAAGLLVLGGILKDASQAEIEAEIATHGAIPDFVIRHFSP